MIIWNTTCLWLPQGAKDAEESYISARRSGIITVVVAAILLFFRRDPYQPFDCRSSDQSIGLGCVNGNR